MKNTMQKSWNSGLLGAAASAAVLVAAATALAQDQTKPADSPVTQSSHMGAQAEAGEPRADTGGPAPTPSAGAPAAETPAPSAGTPAASAVQAAETPAPAAGKSARKAHTPAVPRAAASGPKAPATDRLDLGVATVTGDREQPKVMYIVPWKKSDIGDLSGKPMHSLLDEALAPVDRDEFKREVVYYQAVNADASQNGASRPAAKGEK
jgi:hypothetical protein